MTAYMALIFLANNKRKANCCMERSGIRNKSHMFINIEINSPHHNSNTGNCED